MCVQCVSRETVIGVKPLSLMDLGVFSLTRMAGTIHAILLYLVEPLIHITHYTIK